jgi:cytochrome oxidase Cu insertion factor (SCO1/SenC/PrrC family)
MSSDPKSAPGARVQHSTRFVLVDKNGAIRGFYDGLGDLDNNALARDARRLLEVDS